MPFFQSYLAKAHAMLGQFDEAQHHIDQAIATIESSGERVWAAEVQRLAGEIALLSPRADATEAQTHFECALSLARHQLAKAHAMLGQFDEAQHHIDQAMAIIELTGEKVWAPEIHRLAGMARRWIKQRLFGQLQAPSTV
jgi:tetratricopeptide (TPR) repeat protein